jgi:hypothetical protein
MKGLHIKPWFSSCLLFIMISLSLLFSACGDDSSSSDDSSSNRGSIVYTAVWPDAVNQNSQNPGRAINCADTGVSTVNATIFNSDDIEVASQSWPCADHQGTINDVPVGSGMSLLLEGLVSGNVEFSGVTSTPFTVSGGQTTNVGEIPMSQSGPTLYWDIGNWDDKNWG